MDKAAQRIAIAEACGLDVCGGFIFAMTPNPETGEPVQHPVASVPDYLNDLNAMHEVTSVLGDSQTRRFTDELIKVTNANTYKDIVIYSSLYDATASQRAEAFLRSIGKWKESPDE